MIRVIGAHAKWMLIAVFMLSCASLACADDDIPLDLYLGDYVKANVRIHLDSGVVSFPESFWTLNKDIKGKTFDVFPQKVLREKVAGGEVLLVIPKDQNGIADKLYFLFDNGKTIHELFYPDSIGVHWSKVFLHDVNGDGTDEFVIQEANKDWFWIDVYSVNKDTKSEFTAEMFTTGSMHKPKQKGIKPIEVNAGRIYVHYEYRGADRTAEIRVNKDDPTREPYLYPIGISK